MKPLSSLLQGIDSKVQGSTDVMIRDITFDSRKVKPGSLFVALRGTRQDGRSFISSAIEAGAVAVLADAEIAAVGNATRIQVNDALKSLAPLAVRFWDNPSKKLCMVGITGTNGKTTTTYLVESIFNTAGWPTGVMGTINYRYGKSERPAPNTTPFASEVQRFLAELVEQKAKACVMEVSSHALELGRVEGIDFDVAVFTNLSQDHLDFHKTMDAYSLAKAKLFSLLDPKTSKSFARCAVVNADDPASEKMMVGCRVPVLRYSIHSKADLYPKNLLCDATGSRFDLYSPLGHAPVQTPLLGEYNVMNALAAAGVAASQGHSLETIVEGLTHAPAVPGRMERLVSAKGFTAVVDYAHTDDALRKVMETLKKLKPRKLITVFGCGGDRDRTKRPLMGEAAAQMSDEVIVTSDNPRSEDPERITLDIEVGVRRVRSENYQIVLDRAKAIETALSMAQEGDIVLVAGKGHENYQILSDKTIPFDDREVIRRLLQLPR
jgi:UDP-N-acetylmuramoyl-L-alanyl-D-glutamate--2,6-diaminopimelate ligase